MERFQEKFLREAIRLAEENIHTGVGGPFGAVVVKDGEIIAKGSNHVTSHNDPTAHAEVVAIREACKVLNDFQLTGCELYTSCEPCPMCLGAIYWARPDRFYYAGNKKDAADAGFDDSFIYEEIPLPPEKRSIPGKQALQHEAVKVFKIWTETENKTEY
jgi:tRNA(Arg) A34 adenosine deaminase TadA